MKDAEINIAIAESLGWTDVHFYEDNAGPGFWSGLPPTTIGVDGKGEWIAVKPKYHGKFPDYASDLNAMHEAEKALIAIQRVAFYDMLNRTTPLGSWMVSATARQRAEAYLRTIGKWKEAE